MGPFHSQPHLIRDNIGMRHVAKNILQSAYKLATFTVLLMQSLLIKMKHFPFCVVCDGAV